MEAYMGSFSAWHWLIVLAILVLLFGRGKFPALMEDVASGIKKFRREMPFEDAIEQSNNDPKHG